MCVILVYCFLSYTKQVMAIYLCQAVLQASYLH